MAERRTCDCHTQADLVAELRERVRRLEGLLTYRYAGAGDPEIRQALAHGVESCAAFPPYGAGYTEALTLYDQLIDWRTGEQG